MFHATSLDPTGAMAFVGVGASVGDGGGRCQLDVNTMATEVRSAKSLITVHE